MKRWEDTVNRVGEEVHNLYFSHHNGEEKLICCLFKGSETNEWLYTSDLLNGFFEKLFNFTKSEICLHDAKLEIESRVYSHYEDEMKYYEEILQELDI